MSQPSYGLSELIKGCKLGEKAVRITPSAMETAREDFGLKTAKDVLNFISEGGLEEPDFINSRLWEKNPSNVKEIMVDAYAFYSGSAYGYIAFRKEKKWIIKSLKKNKNPDARNRPFICLKNLKHIK